MPKRKDLKKILIIGSGPIIIGQACEFDYSGTQACKALKEEGYTVVLINSNPATIMTDPQFADRTYIEPLTIEFLEKVIKKERPDALLPTLGGQTGLNLSFQAARLGILEKYSVEMIGASAEAIEKAEERELFKKAMEKIGLKVPESGIAHSPEEALEIATRIGFPVIIRPSFTLGGTGGGVAYNREEFLEIARKGLDLSITGEILVEQSLLGWKEFELEVMRDLNDNVVIICSIENLDPMGVHTGDSITVAPAQTLTDKEYQIMRDSAIAIIREIGVDTGGSNIQFAVNPKTGEQLVIEMNPRVSRSSALASKATGFPIAKIAAKLAIGYTLDEIPNDITKKTPACFEPTIDYCVIKIPKFNFEKFAGTSNILGSSMKSVGEIMAIGRTFKEAFNKGLRSLETKIYGLVEKGQDLSDQELEFYLKNPTPERLFYIKTAILRGYSPEKIAELTAIDRWFIDNIFEIVNIENKIKHSSITPHILLEAKKAGFSDKYIGILKNKTEQEIRELRKKYNILPVYKQVDTCAAEFEAETPYYYSTYEATDESYPSNKKKVIILGSGPNRIGQGIEFDYCCVQAVFAAKELGYEAIMVNSNPETVSTDYDTSDKLYFEPLTFEDVLNIVENEKPEGIIVQFGGQTPLNLAVALEKAGVKILGTSSDAIDRAENRERFKALVEKLNLLQPPSGTAYSLKEAIHIANNIGYPVMVRPSYVLGGRAMEIIYDEKELCEFIQNAIDVSGEHPVLIDKFLENATEVDVDALCDGEQVVIGGILEHIEEAGVHSGDSACVIPPHTLSKENIKKIKETTKKIGLELGVVGLMNIQYAIKDDKLYILEVNPRASRTVPFISKATGMPLAKIATKVILGKTLKELGVSEVKIKHTAVKESVLPFSRFSGVDAILGPEMKSTGEVMGIDNDCKSAIIKSQIAAGMKIEKQGNVFISVKDQDKPNIVKPAILLKKMGYTLIATKNTAKFLREKGIEVKQIAKISEGRPNVVDLMKNKDVCLIINTPSGKSPRKDEITIRTTAVLLNIPLITTTAAANEVIEGLIEYHRRDIDVKPLQEYYTSSQKYYEHT